ncbi:UNVERIFIED_CONTAM: hypothetical protein RMT77_004569 [Armadillidium vulgare]
MASISAIRNRTKDKIFIVGYPAHQITSCKLPSNRQVLATLFYTLRTVKLDLRDSARITIQEVLVFWGKARIPTKHVKDAITKLEKLHAEWRNVQKDQDKQSEAAKNKINEFASKVDDIFDIAHQDALAMMKSEESKEFLLKQREKARPGSMLGVDLKLARAEKENYKKNLRKMNEHIQTECLFDIETDDEEDEDSDEEENTCDEDIEDVLPMDVCASQETEELP